MARLRVRSGKNGKSYQVIYKDPRTGLERCKTHATRKAAIDFQESIVISGRLHDRDTITISTAADRWLHIVETVGRRGREPVEKSTLIKYEEHARFIKREIGGHKLSRLTPQIIAEFREKLLSTFSRKYAKKFLVSLKAILNQAIADGHLMYNPAAEIGIHISGRTTGNEKPPIPSIADLRAILAAADALATHENGTIKRAWQRYRPLFYVLAFSGMRPTEALGLPWKNVDFKNGTIKISQDANIDGTIGLPKSASSYRTIPMPDDVMIILKAWKLGCPLSDWDLVFPNYVGNIESHHNITNRGWYVLLKETGLIDTHPNGEKSYRYPLKSLRHVRASLEITTGADAKEVQMLMGHSSIKVTFDVYGHLFNDHEGDRKARANSIATHILEKDGQKTGKLKKSHLKTIS